jgi:hypothetical protein
MTLLPPGVKVHLAFGYIDMRKGINGLSAPPTSRFAGREVAVPPSSAACMTDHGPSQCDELMWVYGSPGSLT